MNKIALVGGLGVISLALGSDPCWANVAHEAATIIGGSGKKWSLFDSPWPFLLVGAVFIKMAVDWYGVFPPAGYAIGALGIVLIAHAVGIVGNFYGSNPRGDVTIFTYQNPYYISQHEHERMTRLVWKFNEECEPNHKKYPDTGCSSRVWKAYHECVRRNNCRDVMVEVYNERRRELAANPHAFSSFKPCADRSQNSWAKCW